MKTETAATQIIKKIAFGSQNQRDFNRQLAEGGFAVWEVREAMGNSIADDYSKWEHERA